MKKTLFIILACTIVINPFIYTLPARADNTASAEQAAQNSDEIIADEVLNVGEDSDITAEEVDKNKPLFDAAQKFDDTNNRFNGYENLFNMVDQSKIVMSEQDLEAVRQGRIDERILRSLIYLVTPTDQGGAGFERLKIKRLVKGYSTEQRSLSKESEYNNESEVNISAHYKGQAVDISEIDLIKVKKKTKKKFLGTTYSSKTGGLPSVPINVAWQSDKGKGEAIPGFYGDTANDVFGNLSTGSLKEMLSDLVEYNLADLQGENLPEWAQYLGIISLFEDFDLPVDGFVKNEDGKVFEKALKQMGRAALAQRLGVDIDAVQGNSSEELIMNMGRNYIEKKLQLANGSLTGNSLEEIFLNAGKRKLESQLGLPQGRLDGDIDQMFKKIKENAKWKAYKTNEAKDQSFDIPDGSAQKIESGDQKGLMLAGAGIVLYTLAASNKNQLLDQIKNNGSITSEIEIDNAQLRVDLDINVLKNVASKDKQKRIDALKSLGNSAISSIAFHPDLSLNLTKDEWTKVLSGKTKIDDLILTVGSRKYENELNLPRNALYYTIISKKPGDLLLNIGKAELQARGEDLNKYSDTEKQKTGKDVLQKTIVSQINKQYHLTDKYAKYQVTEDDVVDLINGKWESVAQKVAGRQIDRALGFPENGTMEIINGAKSADQILQESGAVRFGKLMGLTRPVPIEGDLKQNYGQTLFEESLGLQPSSFSGTIGEAEAKNPGNLSYLRQNPGNYDATFGLKPGTTQGLLDGKTSVGDYNKAIADKALLGVTLDRVANYFGLEGDKKPTQQELNQIITAVQNWNATTPETKANCFNTLQRISGRSWDEQLGFESGTISQIITNPNLAPEILLTQGMKKINDKIFGIDKEVIVLHYRDGKKLDFIVDGKALQNWAIPKIKEQTGISVDDDAGAFLNGNYKDGFTFWGIASLTKEANDIFVKKNIPNAIFTYEDAKKAFYGDLVAEDQVIEETWTKYKSENPETPDSFKDTLLTTENQQEVRKELRNQARKDFQYRVYDAYLIDKVDENIPLGFAKTMYQGTPEERTTMMGSYLISKV
ncbi:MAG: hypothetical protein NT135_01380, partial [Candidatus Berkelbacteria bacterium]|nr:hypothetical protein [Candidatus Berkelbacteria bacterium]